MMTSAEYTYAWIYYIVGCFILIGCWWYLTRPIPWAEVRHVLRLIVAVVLLVPWYSNTQQDYLSPALLIAAVEALFDGADAFWRAGTPLLVATALAVSLSALAYTARWMIMRRRAAH
ncbi:hypothetical protein P886_4083 [Alteromonadaceae bacterium 2753L.S.0a.02]|nr:hypothetical protein P886_4083 [Alteromonadaceae bacterium 2753L.S.0a.02]